jgi:hypothetical protein
MWIIKITEDFIEKARAFTSELISYKAGDNEWDRKEYLGDLDPEYCKNNELRGRYNVNHQGDIYFINAAYTNYLLEEAFYYKDYSRREAAGFKSKAVLKDIAEHHNKEKVGEIVRKYFFCTPACCTFC